jgi:hypothetical protein
MKSDQNMKKDVNDEQASNTSMVVAVGAAAAALSYAKPAYSIAIIDDIAIAIANAAAKMYEIAANGLMDTWYEKDIKNSATTAQSWAQMGDAYINVKLTIASKYEALSALESSDNCNVRYGQESRKKGMVNSIKSQSASLIEGSYDVSVNQVSMAVDLLGQDNRVLSKQVSKYLGGTGDAYSIEESSSKLAIDAAISMYPYRQNLTGANKLAQMNRNALLAGSEESGAQIVIDAIKETQGSAAKGRTLNETFRQVPYGIAYSSILTMGLSSGLELSGSSFGTSQYGGTTALMEQAKNRATDAEMHQGLKNTPNEISSVMEMYYQVGLEMGTYLEMYRTNELTILTLVTQLLDGISSGENV